jgi:hypothetical protein
VIFRNRLLVLFAAQRDSMSDRDQQQSVENYTNAFLVSFGLLLFMVLLTIASLLGGLWMLLTAVLVNQLITWRGRILGG